MNGKVGADGKQHAYVSQAAAYALQQAVNTSKTHYVPLLGDGATLIPQGVGTAAVVDAKPAGAHLALHPNGAEFMVKPGDAASLVPPSGVAGHARHPGQRQRRRLPPRASSSSSCSGTLATSSTPTR